MIFTILRAYSEYANSQKAGEHASERTVIFAIEEPELYLHPQAQRTLMKVLRDISGSKDQIIYSTHSSLFVDIGYFDEVCIMRKRENGKKISYTNQFTIPQLIDDLKARKGLQATDNSMRELYSHVFNPMINEGFFSSKVIIVEGDSELYMLPILAELLGFNFDKNNVSILHSNGKGSIDRLLRVFNGFKIPTYVLFDGDKHTSKKENKEKTLELLEMLGNKKDSIDDVVTEINKNHAVFEQNLEKMLAGVYEI